MREGRPRVFVSSTIYDFADLRSALKYWLEEAGFDAQLSEYNDFAKPLDTNSFDACLRSAENSDYFVLLIGARVGGLFSKPDGISITRQEYRRAYDAFQRTGRPKILTFVRRDVWTVREDRTALEELLRQMLEQGEELPSMHPDHAKRIAQHQSKFVRDAGAIFDFLDEVKRKDEMIAAVRAGHGYPSGNWVHVFAEFADIVSALQRDIRAGSVSRAAVEANLRVELIALAEHLTADTANGIVPLTVRVPFLAAPDLISTDLDKVVWLDGEDLGNLAAFSLMSAPIGQEITTHALDEAIRSGEFFQWEPSVNAFTITPFHAALVALREEIALFRRNCAFAQDSWIAERDEWASTWRQKKGEKWGVKGWSLTPYASLHHRQQNLLAISAALIAAMAGNTRALTEVRLWPFGFATSEKRPIRFGTGKRVRLASWLHDLAEGSAAKPDDGPPATT